MKNKYLNVWGLQAFIIIASVLLFPVAAHSQELTELQKKERCQNNKNRIVELEIQLRVIDAELSQTMETKEMEDARTEMVFVRRIKNTVNSNSKLVDFMSGDVGGKYLGVLNDDWDKYNRISAQYNFNQFDCVFLKDEKLDRDERNLICITELEKIIANKINKATSLNRAALLTKKNETEKQLAKHRTNLIALGCDQPVDISGTWNSSLGAVYQISQNGANFTWSVSKFSEKGEGEISGSSISAKWTGNYTNGSANGSVKSDAAGKANRIEWNNGVVFMRN